MNVISVVFLLGALCLCDSMETQTTTELLKQAALKLKEPLTCNKWDCNCTFNRQRGCCCAVEEMYTIEEQTLHRMIYLADHIYSLDQEVKDYAAATQVSFKASMDPSIAVMVPGSSERCFGPFNANMPIPYAVISLNQGRAYNGALGTFTAPYPGVYSFSYTVYSSVKNFGRLYHKVQLMKNGQSTASVWENNREDGEDSATQVVLLDLDRGDQVYVALMSGRKLCRYLQFNVFTGYMVYPHSHHLMHH